MNSQKSWILAFAVNLPDCRDMPWFFHKCCIFVWEFMSCHLCRCLEPWMFLLLTRCLTMMGGGVLASDCWWEAWWPSPKVDPGAFSGQRQGWKTGALHGRPDLKNSIVIINLLQGVVVFSLINCNKLVHCIVLQHWHSMPHNFIIMGQSKSQRRSLWYPQLPVYRASRGCVHRRCSYFAAFLW